MRVSGDKDDGYFLPDLLTNRRSYDLYEGIDQIHVRQYQDGIVVLLRERVHEPLFGHRCLDVFDFDAGIVGITPHVVQKPKDEKIAPGTVQELVSVSEGFFVVGRNNDVPSRIGGRTDRNLVDVRCQVSVAPPIDVATRTGHVFDVLLAIQLVVSNIHRVVWHFFQERDQILRVVLAVDRLAQTRPVDKVTVVDKKDVFASLLLLVVVSCGRCNGGGSRRGCIRIIVSLAILLQTSPKRQDIPEIGI
mmetsp:Transcript_1080/g.2414  ORF Transcript_1080/g.2414 Transcript_1080/m.2414 type:complete len:247 (+) Transcript_1080:1615-2355(+)